ncbi:hypothetical protein BASA81_008610 [Batrachochytrium salamandrivorans]|nr:hypothetical protein BASA81_008610 [Batrachochytrium salamandrivorans]
MAISIQTEIKYLGYIISSKWDFHGSVKFLLYKIGRSKKEKLNGRADSLSRREDYFLDGDQSNFQRIIDPDNVLDLQVAMADLDLHVLVHSTVLDKVFVQEADWPLIIADFLAGEDNVWIEEISEDWLELCKKELKEL